MLKRLANKLMMYNAVKSHLTQNRNLWAAMPAMTTTFADFDALLSGIETYQQLSRNNPKGITQQKATLQELVIGHTYELSSVLYALATRQSDVTLAAKVDFTETDLLKKRDEELVSTCRIVAELVAEQLSPLAAYSVSDEELIRLRDEINQFAECLPNGRISVSERKTANTKLKTLFEQTDALLKTQLDRLMVRYRTDQPEFYSSYKSSRHVINYGVRHTQAKTEEKTA